MQLSNLALDYIPIHSISALYSGDGEAPGVGLARGTGIQMTGGKFSERLITPPPLLHPRALTRREVPPKLKFAMRRKQTKWG